VGPCVRPNLHALRVRVLETVYAVSVIDTSPVATVWKANEGQQKVRTCKALTDEEGCFAVVFLEFVHNVPPIATQGYQYLDDDPLVTHATHIQEYGPSS